MGHGTPCFSVARFTSHLDPKVNLGGGGGGTNAKNYTHLGI